MLVTTNIMENQAITENREKLIELLQDEQVDKKDVEKLKKEAINSIEALLMHTKKELLQIPGLSEQKVEKIYTAALKIRV